MILLLMLFAQLTGAPQVSVQWTLAHPKGFQIVSDWNSLPSKPDPTSKGLKLDDQPGWVAAVRIGAYTVAGCDKYAVLQNSGSVDSYCMGGGGDSLYAYPFAEVCHYIGTGRTCKAYGRRKTLHADTALPMDQFHPPAAQILYGKMVTDAEWKAHKALW